jgi:hypothetical protein
MATNRDDSAVARRPAEGEMGTLMRTYDWQRTPLGPPDGWPQSLRTIANIFLSSRYAMWVGWGEDLTFFYNDATVRLSVSNIRGPLDDRRGKSGRKSGRRSGLESNWC